MVLHKPKDQRGQWLQGLPKLAVTVMNMKNTDELCPRSMLVRQRGLTGVGEERKSPPLSGPSQGDAAAGLMKDEGATAAAVTELGQKSDGARRKKESVRRKRWAGLFIRQSHKWARDSRRPRRGYLPLTAPRFSE